jgi:hypothetical protein
MEREIMAKFLDDYMITDDKDDYITQSDLAEWAKKNGFIYTKFIKLLQQYCWSDGCKFVKMRLHKKERVCTGITERPYNTPMANMEQPISKVQEQALAEEQECIAPGRPFDMDNLMNISDLDGFEMFTDYKFNPKTLNVYLNDKLICWISFDPQEEFIILQQDSHKELLLKEILLDYIVEED